MKKLHFLLGATAVLLASCSNDEVVDVAQSQGIGFNTFVDKSTRATTDDDITSSSLSSFAVYGVTWKGEGATPSQVFVNQEVKKNGTDWTYAPLRYWVVGNSYRFTAIAPYNATGLTVDHSVVPMPAFADVKGGLSLTFDNATAAADVDLCYADNKVESATATQDAVDLTFSHMLSRVKFTFKNTFESVNSNITISDVKITDATAKASINKVDGEMLWTPSADAPGTFTIPFTNVITAELQSGRLEGGESMETEHQYIIPVNGESTYHVSFVITLYNYDPDKDLYTEVAKYPHNNVALPVLQYTNNYSYNFVAEINNKTIDPDNELTPILFKPSVEPWGDFKNEDVTIKTNGGTTE